MSSKPNFKKANWEKWQNICDDILPNLEDIHIDSKLDLDILIKKTT